MSIFYPKKQGGRAAPLERPVQMNDDASPPSLLTIAPRPEKTFITDKLSHPATVLHPTFSGDMKQFDVTVESVFNREEDGETRLAFRGKDSKKWISH